MLEHASSNNANSGSDKHVRAWSILGIVSSTMDHRGILNQADYKDYTQTMPPNQALPHLKGR